MVGHSRILHGAWLRRLGCAAGCVAVLALAGCGLPGLNPGPDNTSIPQELVPAAHQMVDDIQVPSVYELVSEQSTGYIDTETRIIAHEYTGRASVPAVREFYRDRLLKAGWRWLRDATLWEHMMIFEHEYMVRSTGRKARERCYIYIKPIGHGKTRLRITLMPEPMTRE